MPQNIYITARNVGYYSGDYHTTLVYDPGNGQPIQAIEGGPAAGAYKLAVTFGIATVNFDVPAEILKNQSDSNKGTDLQSYFNSGSGVSGPVQSAQVVTSGADLSGVWQEMEQTASNVSGHYQYELFTTNSNSFVDTVLACAGYSNPFAGNSSVPGVDNFLGTQYCAAPSPYSYNLTPSGILFGETLDQVTTDNFVQYTDSLQSAFPGSAFVPSTSPSATNFTYYAAPTFDVVDSTMESDAINDMPFGQIQQRMNDIYSKLTPYFGADLYESTHGI